MITSLRAITTRRSNELEIARAKADAANRDKTRCLAAASHDILHEAQAQHHRILEAVEARDGARAEALTREHATLARDNLHLALESQAALRTVPGGALIRLPERS